MKTFYNLCARFDRDVRLTQRLYPVTVKVFFAYEGHCFIFTNFVKFRLCVYTSRHHSKSRKFLLVVFESMYLIQNLFFMSPKWMVAENRFNCKL